MNRLMDASDSDWMLAIFLNEISIFPALYAEDFGDIPASQLWRDAVQSTYDMNASRVKMRLHFTELLTLDHVRDSLAFYESAAGQRIVAATTRELSADVLAQIMQDSITYYQSVIAGQPELEHELEVLLAIGPAFRTGFDISYIYHYGLILGVNSAVGGDDADDGSTTAQIAGRTVADIMPQLRSLVYGQTAAQYGAVHLDDLRAYNTFLQTPAGVAFVEAMRTLHESLFWPHLDALGQAFGEGIASHL